jgi:hypothetical protein
MPALSPRSPRPSPPAQTAAAVPARLPGGGWPLPAASAAARPDAEAAARAERLGHRLDCLSVKGADRPEGVVQRAKKKQKIKVEYQDGVDRRGRLRINLKGRAPWGTVDTKLSKEESEKSHYVGGKLGPGLARGHIVGWSLKRKALEKRLQRTNRRNLLKGLGLDRNATPPSIQDALKSYTTKKYRDPRNLAINDQKEDEKAGNLAEELTQSAEKVTSRGDTVHPNKLSQIYDSSFNPGLSLKGATDERFNDLNRDFKTVWGANFANTKWEENLRSKYPETLSRRLKRHRKALRQLTGGGARTRPLDLAPKWRRRQKTIAKLRRTVKRSD